MESRKNGIDDLICKAEPQILGTNIRTPRVESGEDAANWEMETVIYTSLCIK